MGEPRLFCFGLGYTARVLAAAGGKYIHETEI